jgi:predicted transcriptional regulator
MTNFPNQDELDRAAEASAAEGIRQGLADLKAGRTRPAREVLEEMRAELGIPERGEGSC